jgi:hypothetical protein
VRRVQCAAGRRSLSIPALRLFRRLDMQFNAGSGGGRFYHHFPRMRAVIYGFGSRLAMQAAVSADTTAMSLARTGRVAFRE